MPDNVMVTFNPDVRMVPSEFLIRGADSPFKFKFHPLQRFDRLLYHLNNEELQMLMKDPSRLSSMVEQEYLRRLNNDEKRRDSFGEIL